MNKLIFGSAFVICLIAGTATSSFAAGDGLSPNAARTGNSTFAGQHIEAAHVHRRTTRMGRYMHGKHSYRRHYYGPDP